MSYSFSVRAATKAEAKEAVAAKMAEVVQSQPVHAADQQQAVAAASAFIDVLPDDESKDVNVTVYGSVSWAGTLGEHTLTGASVSASAYLVVKETQI